MNRRMFLLTGAAGVAFAPSLGKARSSGSFEVTRTPAEWRAILTENQYLILRKHQTERAYSSPLNAETRRGVYHCVGCDAPLYTSETKYDSGTGWPSFYASMPGAIGTQDDNTLFARRTEVHCGRCGGHLGHIFGDGPPPTGKRHCINGLTLAFRART